MIFSKPKYYNSIHNCPVSVFSEIQRTGNISALHISGNKDNHLFFVAWSSIMNEFIAEFGLNNAYQQYLKLMAKVVNLNYDIYIKGHKWKKIKAKSKEAQAKSMIATDHSVSISEVIADISKQMGFRVDPQTTTVFEFYGYIKHLNKQNGR